MENEFVSKLVLQAMHVGFRMEDVEMKDEEQNDETEGEKGIEELNVTLDPKKHVGYMWATKGEVDAVVEMGREKKQTVMDAFEYWEKLTGHKS